VVETVLTAQPGQGALKFSGIHPDKKLHLVRHGIGFNVGDRTEPSVSFNDLTHLPQSPTEKVAATILVASDGGSLPPVLH
jgi:hypothetical protein